MKFTCFTFMLVATFATRIQAQDPITLIASTLIPKLVEGTNAVIDKVKENKEAKNKQKEKTQLEVDKALKKLQQDNADNLTNLNKSIKESNGKVTELKKIYANIKELLYPLGSLQALTDPDLHNAIINSSDLKKVIISRYRSTWHDMKYYYESVSKLQDDDQWNDPTNKVALTNDVKTVFDKLNRIQGIVANINEPSHNSADAEIEQHRRAISRSSTEIADAKKAVIEILDLLTARLSLSKNETDELVRVITTQKEKIEMP
ncbi:hypothetical protein [Parachryseolinea silvisoli]|jgi:hypothetical protein|uniref:hypothetical protein n=1 Tax=Parachryseolinea silvisoli TaxID=2873601 RepID=UPI002265C5D3|nr:hypothetical protein [Parachryseolinea silvisoli]MCD9015893.1 hypothetical protein [Parachryseolinea silvisoli]